MAPVDERCVERARIALDDAASEPFLDISATLTVGSPELELCARAGGGSRGLGHCGNRGGRGRGLGWDCVVVVDVGGSEEVGITASFCARWHVKRCGKVMRCFF